MPKWTDDDDCALIDFVYREYRKGTNITDILFMAADKTGRSRDAVRHRWYKTIMPTMEELKVLRD